MAKPKVVVRTQNMTGLKGNNNGPRRCIRQRKNATSPSKSNVTDSDKGGKKKTSDSSSVMPASTSSSNNSTCSTSSGPITDSPSLSLRLSNSLEIIHPSSTERGELSEIKSTDFMKATPPTGSTTTSRASANYDGLITSDASTDNQDVFNDRIQDEPQSSSVLLELPLRDVVAYVESFGAKENMSVCVAKELERLGASISPTINNKVTHFVFQDGRLGSFRKAQQKQIPIVSVLWVEKCRLLKKKVPEQGFIIEVNEEDGLPTPDMFGKSKRRRHMNILPQAFEIEMAQSEERVRVRALRAKRQKLKKLAAKYDPFKVLESLNRQGSDQAVRKGKELISLRNRFNEVTGTPGFISDQEEMDLYPELSTPLSERIKRNKAHVVVSAEETDEIGEILDKSPRKKLLRRKRISEIDINLASSASESESENSVSVGPTQVIRVNKDKPPMRDQSVNTSLKNSSPKLPVTGPRSTSAGWSKCSRKRVKTTPADKDKGFDDVVSRVCRLVLKTPDKITKTTTSPSSSPAKKETRKKTVKKRLRGKVWTKKRSCASFSLEESISPSQLKITRSKEIARKAKTTAKGKNRKKKIVSPRPRPSPTPGDGRLTSMSNIASEDEFQKLKGNSFRVHQPLHSLVFGGMDPRDKEAALAIAKKLGCNKLFSKEVTDCTTHVIMGSESSMPIDVVYGIARGCWIVSLDWIYMSLESGSWLPEEGFQIEKPQFSAAKHRHEWQSKGVHSSVFASVGPIFISPQSDITTAHLAKLVRLCGGRVTTSSKRAAVFVGSKKGLPRLSSCTPLPIVKETWILDSICTDETKALDDYEID